MWSVKVGTRTSAVFTASINWSVPMGLSSRFNWTSNSSIIRVSTASGSLRVTTTSGFFSAIRNPPSGRPRRQAIATRGGLVQHRVVGGSPRPAGRTGAARTDVLTAADGPAV